MKKLETTTETNEEKFAMIIEQHVQLLQQIKMVSNLQSEIANQVVKQHDETESLYKALGLKKDLSYYSFNLINEEEH